MSKDLIENKENFIIKIKNFFLKLFGIESISNEKDFVEIKNETVSNNKSNFEENIVIKQDEEEIRIMKLQKDYKAGKILEKDLNDNDLEKLIQLYKKQNLELKNKIELKKKELRKRLDNLATA